MCGNHQPERRLYLRKEEIRPRAAVHNKHPKSIISCFISQPAPSQRESPRTEKETGTGFKWQPRHWSLPSGDLFRRAYVWVFLYAGGVWVYTVGVWVYSGSCTPVWICVSYHSSVVFHHVGFFFLFFHCHVCLCVCMFCTGVSKYVCVGVCTCVNVHGEASAYC